MIQIHKEVKELNTGGRNCSSLVIKERREIHWLFNRKVGWKRDILLFNKRDMGRRNWRCRRERD